MKPERKTQIGAHTVEEYCWAGRMVVYIDNYLAAETYDTAIERLRRLV